MTQKSKSFTAIFSLQYSKKSTNKRNSQTDSLMELSRNEREQLHKIFDRNL